MTPRRSFTYRLNGTQRTALVQHLKTGNYLPLKMEHTVIAARTPDCVIALYKSGKCLIQGKGADEFITFVMEPQVLGEVSLGYEEELNPELTTPHIGVDESGKGDFFGPLVIAAAYVDPDIYSRMKEMGVKDSKRITSDNKALGMGRELRLLLGKRHAVVTIGPRTYNRLYSRMRNVNALLAWAHARAIEDLLEAVPDCPMAISDKFGSERQVKQALMKRGRSIELIQRVRAESDLAVAAASIIAREQFLLGLKKLESGYEGEFPKGASAGVREAAVALVGKRGPEILLDTAKCHFQTTDKVLLEAGSSRDALGPEGKATSRPKGTFTRRKSGS